MQLRDYIPLNKALELMGIPRSTYFYNRRIQGFYPETVSLSQRRVLMKKEDVAKWIEQGGHDLAKSK